MSCVMRGVCFLFIYSMFNAGYIINMLSNIF